MARRLRESMAVHRLDPVSGQRDRTDGIREQSIINSLLRFCGLVKDERGLDQFEPVYGLPTRSLNEWLSRNPALKEEYEAELRFRSRRSRSTCEKQ